MTTVIIALIEVQLPPSSHTLLRPWISLLGGFEQAANSMVRSQRNNRKTRKWITPKQVLIRPKYKATVAFSWPEDRKMKQKKESIQTSSGPRPPFRLNDLRIMCKTLLLNISGWCRCMAILEQNEIYIFCPTPVQKRSCVTEQPLIVEL